MMNTQRMNRICSFLFLLLLPLLFLGCSSSPRRQGDSRVIRNLAANQINLANQSMLQGRYEEALFILDEARRLALSVDDPALRVQVAISQGSVHFAMGQEARAFQEWRDAVLLAETWGLSDLAAHARIIEIQGELFLLDQRGGDNYHQAEELKTRLDTETSRLRRNSASLPIAYLAQGMAGKLMEEWDEAESSLRRAIRIYERENRLEEAAYGWYILASVFSVAGQYDAALSALWTAIDLDRRAENGFGLTSSYQAMTAVLDKAGRTEEAQEARTRAEEIHRALFYGQAGEAGARD